MSDLDTGALLCNEPQEWLALVNDLDPGRRWLGLNRDDRRRLKQCHGPVLADNDRRLMTQNERLQYRQAQPLHPRFVPLRCVTPFEQLSYIAAVCDLEGEGDVGRVQALRIRFARRVSQARERRRELAIRLFRENPIDPEHFLDLVVGLAMRSFAVPPLLLENPPTLRQRITAAEFSAVINGLPHRPYDHRLIENLRNLLNNSAGSLSYRVEQALTCIFGPENRRLPQAVDACTWIKTAAEMAQSGTRVRTVRAMYAPNQGSGQAIDLVIALCPPGERRDLDILLDEHQPGGLDTVLRAAYAAVTKTLDRQEGWTIRAWLHDFPGGSTAGGPPIGEISSAGTASAIAIASALTGRSIRDDIVSTGTISGDGGVGSVAATIPSKVGGLFGWLNPAMDTNPDDRLSFALGFVPGADLDAARAAASQASDRIRPLATVKDDVLSLDHSPLERPRFERYRENPFSTRKQSEVDADVAETISGLLDRFMESYQPKSLTTVWLPWWLPKDGVPRTDLESALHLVRAEWIGDGLLARLIDRVNRGQREPIPVFLNSGDIQKLVETRNRQWLPETVRRIVTAAGDDADLYTITTMLREGYFTLIVDADRLNSETIEVLRQATRTFSQCHWIFLSHVTRCGETPYARHGALLDKAFQPVDLMDVGQNSSVWDGYLQRTAKELVQQRAGNGVLKTDREWLEAYFGDGRYLGRSIPRYLQRKLGSPQEPAGRDYQVGPRKAPATLDNSSQGLFSRQRAYPLEIIEARSGRGKSLVGLHTMFVWLRGGEASIRKFDVVPIFLDANLHSSRRNSIHDALNADLNNFEPAIGAALEAVLRGEHLDSRDPEREKAEQEFEAILDALGNPEIARCRELLLNALGPTAIMIDGLREVPDSKLKAERIVPNLIRLANVGPVPSRSADDDPKNQLPLSRVVLFWRSDVVKTDFATTFAEQLGAIGQQHRISELLPFDRKDLLSGYLEPAFEEKPQVLDELKNEPGLLSTLASNLRVLEAVTRLKMEDIEGLKKPVVERRWDPDKGEFEDRKFPRLTGGRILRWALIKDYKTGFEDDEQQRDWDGKWRALEPGRPGPDEEQRELIALGLLAFLATVKGQGAGQLTIDEVRSVLDQVLELQGTPGRYQLWQDLQTRPRPVGWQVAIDTCARDLEKITKRVWVKGSRHDPDQWRLDFRHEEDRVLATVWLIDCVLQKYDDPIVGPSLALALRDTEGAGTERTLKGLDLVCYAFALDKGLSRDEVNKRRAEWSAIRLLFEEASDKPRLLFELPEVRRILGML